MRHVMRLPGLCALLLFVVGCSQLHTEVRGGYRWSGVSAVGFEEPSRDPWSLAPVVRAELEAMGYVVAAPGADGQDLLVRFSTQDGPDFTSDGVRVTRPKSLHVKLIDPRSQALVGVADYFLRSSEAPDAGMRTALAGLRDAMRSAARPGQARPVAVPPATPAVAQPAPTAVSPATPTVTPTVVEPAAAASPAPPSGVAPAPVETVVEEEPVIRSREQSPWMPRFKSWGFEEWGKGGREE